MQKCKAVKSIRKRRRRKRDENRTTGSDAEEDDFFCSTLCSGKKHETCQNTYTKEEEEGRGNQRRSCRLSNRHVLTGLAKI